MSKRMRWAWMALFILLAMAAIIINMHSRRILVVHEALPDSLSAKAFKRSVETTLQAMPRLKVRYQYLGFDPDICQSILAQLKAFDPDTVIAEGAGARQCLNTTVAPAIVSMADIPTTDPDRRQHILAWKRLLHDLSPAGGHMLAFRGEGAQSQAEIDALNEAAQAAGIQLEVWPDSAAKDPKQLKALLAQNPPQLVFFGHTAGWSWQDKKQNAQASQAQLLMALRAQTSAPILSSRLENLLQDADMVLAQAPEQRGEFLARAAWAQSAQPPMPYEMAVGLSKNFAAQQRSMLPPFYELSAHMAGFLAGP